MSTEERDRGLGDGASRGVESPTGDESVRTDGATRSNESVRTDGASQPDEWERMIAAFRQSAPRSTGAPPWLESKVMAEIEALPEAGAVRRALRWLVRPAPIRVPPLVGMAAAAAVALLFLLPDGPPAGTPVAGGPGGAGAHGGAEAVVYVQFVLEAPGARSVAVAGDFSEWEPAHTLEDVDGDGVWTGRVPVEPGVHTYMFLIDGEQWRTDPRAERYADDGFGNRNAVLAVTAGT